MPMQPCPRRQFDIGDHIAKAEVEWLDRVQPHHRKDVTPRLRHRSRLLSDSEKRLPIFLPQVPRLQQQV